MQTSELISKVRKIQIVAAHLVDEALAGNYSSAFRGSGMEFNEVREYQPGDDIRSIDWNVTARSREPHVKRFIEEREMTVMILVDGSSSVAFGSGSQSKLEMACEISAVLAFSAIRNNDKVGLILFTDRIEVYLPPKKGKSHVLRVIREILNFSPRRASTDISGALTFLGRVLRRKATAFLVSDFFDEGFEQPLNLACSRHDLIPVRIGDVREHELPKLGLVRIEDAESGKQCVVDTSNTRSRSGFGAAGRTFNEKLEKDFRRRSVDFVSLQTGQDYLPPMKMLFKKRSKKR